MTTLPGDPELPSVMVFAHMDQMGFVVRKVEPDGRIRLERQGGVPERALAGAGRRPVHRVGRPRRASSASRATTPRRPRRRPGWCPTPSWPWTPGFASKAEAEAAGVRIGTPVTYLPRVLELANGRIAGTAIDDRAGCAALLALAGGARTSRGPTLHLVWSVQEEHNLRGVLPAATALAPDIAIAGRPDARLRHARDGVARRPPRSGGGPAMSLSRFHGRGTLNGVIPHPALVRLVEDAAEAAGAAAPALGPRRAP